MSNSTAALTFPLLLAPQIFFYYFGGVGFEHTGREPVSLLYLLQGWSYAFLVLVVFFNCRAYWKTVLVSATVLILAVAIHAFQSFLFDLNFFNHFFIQFVFFAPYGVLSGIILHKHLENSVFLSSIKYHIGVICFCIVVSVMRCLLSEKSLFQNGIGGADYQVTSYFCAFLVGIVLFLLQSRRVHPAAGAAFVIILSAFSITNGGRGGVLLLCTMLVFGFYLLVKNYRKVAIKLMASLAICSLLFWEYFPEFSGGFTRAFSFFSFTDGVKLVYAREEAYLPAMRLIAENLVWGHSLFAYNDVIHPHNIFLDIFLQVGVPLGLMLILGFFYLLSFLFIRKHYLLCIYLMAAFFPLLFSGSYPRSAMFVSGLLASCLVFLGKPREHQ